MKHGYGLIELLSFAFIHREMSSMIDIVTSCGTHLSALKIKDLVTMVKLISPHLCIQALVKFAIHSEIWVCDSETFRFSRVSLSNSKT